MAALRLKRIRSRRSETGHGHARRLSSLGKTLDERETDLGDFPPPAVDRQGMPATRDLPDLRHAFVALLLVERGIRDRPGHGVVELAIEDEERTSLGVL